MRSIFFVVQVFLLSLILNFLPWGMSEAQEPGPRSQSTRHTFTRTLTPSDTLVSLPHTFVLEQSVVVILDSVTLAAGRDFVLDARFGKIRFVHNVGIDSSLPHRLTVHYLSLPFSFNESYYHRELRSVVDSATGERMKIAQPASSFSLDDMFGSNLQKSGSILRGFTVGSNQDLTLNSGFRMQMSGNLSNDLQLVAALTDEHSPLQPEGTTQTLQEVDNVFIELRGSRMSATLGDFTLGVDGSEFGRIHRKLQGGKGFVNYGSMNEGGDVLFSGASTRGKFTTNQFQGIDGVQGPYRLSGVNGERNIVIIAGTERVYVNGELMTRGALGDYVIDYSNAELTFTFKRLISAVSRLTVDFEYSDRQYPRSLVGGKAGANLLDNRITMHASVFRESDDENSPLDASLSDEDKDTLAAAGDNPSKAVRSGVVYVGPGNGQYLAKDTVYISSAGDTVSATIYRYAPDSAAQAVYAITFSYVGPGSGDYNKRTTYEYFYAGKNAGSYAPIKILPIPQSTAVADADLTFNVSDHLSISGEYAHSNFNANKFSQEAVSEGTSNKFGVQLTPQNVRIGSLNLGSVDAGFRRRFIGKSFVALDRVNDIEFNRKWNSFDSAQSDEELLEGTLGYRPGDILSFHGEAGALTHGDLSSTSRYAGDFGIHGAGIPEAVYGLEYIATKRNTIGQEAKWFRNRANVGDTLGIVHAVVRYEGEDLRNISVVADTLQPGSFRFNEVMPSLVLNETGSISFGGEFSWRWDDSLKDGRLERVSKTFSQSYHAFLRDWNSLSSNVDVTLRKRTFTPLFTDGSDDAIQSVLVRMQTRYNPFKRGIESDWYYEASTGRSAKLERVFQHVQKGSGNYEYIGDLNNNHQSDPEEFRPVRFDGDYILLAIPTDELVPVADVKASTRIRLNGSILASPVTWEGRLIGLFSTETYLRVEEKSTSKDTKDIYLLRLNEFLNDTTTISGSNLVTQDLHILENNPEFSLRFRYMQRNGLTQYALTNERTYAREQSIRLRWHLVREIANETNVTLRTDNLSATQVSDKIRAINGRFLDSQFSYKFERAVELGFSFGFGATENFDTTKADLNDQRVDVIYSIAERAQARIDFAREEVILANAQNYFPYELTGGKVEGHTWLWKGSIDYRFGQYVQATLAYDGRNEGESATVHTVRASVRAFF